MGAPIIRYADGTCYQNVVDENGSQYEKVPCPAPESQSAAQPASQPSLAETAWQTVSSYADSFARALAQSAQPKTVRYSDGTCYQYEIDEFGRHSWKVPCE